MLAIPVDSNDQVKSYYIHPENHTQIPENEIKVMAKYKHCPPKYSNYLYRHKLKKLKHGSYWELKSIKEIEHSIKHSKGGLRSPYTYYKQKGTYAWNRNYTSSQWEQIRRKKFETIFNQPYPEPIEYTLPPGLIEGSPSSDLSYSPIAMW
jgi:hypothetical protein